MIQFLPSSDVLHMFTRNHFSKILIKTWRFEKMKPQASIFSWEYIYIIIIVIIVFHTTIPSCHSFSMMTKFFEVKQHCLASITWKIVNTDQRKCQRNSQSMHDCLCVNNHLIIFTFFHSIVAKFSKEFLCMRLKTITWWASVTLRTWQPINYTGIDTLVALTPEHLWLPPWLPLHLTYVLQTLSQSHWTALNLPALRAL